MLTDMPYRFHKDDEIPFDFKKEKENMFSSAPPNIYYLPARWGPRFRKLGVDATWFTFGSMEECYNELLHGVYKPTNITGMVPPSSDIALQNTIVDDRNHKLNFMKSRYPIVSLSHS